MIIYRDKTSKLIIDNTEACVMNNGIVHLKWRLDMGPFVYLSRLIIKLIRENRALKNDLRRYKLMAEKAYKRRR